VALTVDVAGWSLALSGQDRHVSSMALRSVYLAEEALSLPPEERKALARLLLDSVASDGRSDEEIRADLQNRLDRLKSAEDAGLSFEAVFGEPA
jgi:putative addiction module component (TIGR02574 family)